MDDADDSRESLDQKGSGLGLECDSFNTTFDQSLRGSVVSQVSNCSLNRFIFVFFDCILQFLPTSS